MEKIFDSNLSIDAKNAEEITENANDQTLIENYQ